MTLLDTIKELKKIRQRLESLIFQCDFDSKDKLFSILAHIDKTLDRLYLELGKKQAENERNKNSNYNMNEELEK